MIPLPSTAWLIGGIALIAALSAGGAAWKVAGWRCDAARTASVERAIKQAQDIAAQDAEVAAGYEQTREIIRTVYRNRTMEIVNHVPTLAACTLDPDGLRIANAALVNAPADPAKPDYRLPGHAAVKNWFHGRD